jgi:hypothetical protein
MVAPDSKAKTLPNCGSGYKFAELLRRICDLMVIPADSYELDGALRYADAVVVRADRWAHQRLALNHELPYLLIAHDLACMRDPECGLDDQERETIEAAAAVVFIARGLHDYASEHYTVPAHEIIALRPLARDLDFEPLPRIPHSLVFAGGALGLDVAGSPWAYRVNHSAFAAAVHGGWQMHIYPSVEHPEAWQQLRELGCVIHKPVPERFLPQELSQYTAGLQIFNTDDAPPSSLRYSRLAWPNKCWLYLSAGIPTVGTNPGFESCSIYEGRWGIVLDGAKELADLREEDLPAIDESVRRAEVIDGDLPKLASLLSLVIK